MSGGQSRNPPPYAGHPALNGGACIHGGCADRGLTRREDYGDRIYIDICVYIDCADHGFTRREDRIYCGQGDYVYFNYINFDCGDRIRGCQEKRICCSHGTSQIYSDLPVRAPAKICTNFDCADRIYASRSGQ